MQIRTLLAGSALMALLAGCASSGTQSGTETSAAQDTQATNEVVYKGSLPCRNCSGIDLTVDLQGSESDTSSQTRSFTLDAVYRDHPQNPPAEHYEGNWEVLTGTQSDPQATVYELTPSGDGQVYYFQKIDPTTLELIDPQLRRFENGQNLQLKRQP